MRYVRRDLSPQQTQDLSNRVELQALEATEGSAEGPHVTYASTVPAGRNASGSVSVFIQQAQVPGGSSGLNRFSISIAGCGVEERCSVIRSRAELASQELVHQRMPLDGLGISAVLFGDANRDGLTDVLVRYTDGSGSLYQARRPLPPPSAGTASTYPRTAPRTQVEPPLPHVDTSTSPQESPRPRATEVIYGHIPAAGAQAIQESVTDATDDEVDTVSYFLLQGLIDILRQSAGGY